MTPGIRSYAERIGRKLKADHYGARDRSLVGYTPHYTQGPRFEPWHHMGAPWDQGKLNR